MSSMILVVHMVLALAIIALVLLQRSEGGGLGIGGSGGLGSFASPQSTASVLTRATGICGALFFMTSLILGVLAGSQQQSGKLMEALDKQGAAQTTTAPPVPVAAPEVPARPEAKGKPKAKETPKPAALPQAPVSK